MVRYMLTHPLTGNYLLYRPLDRMGFHAVPIPRRLNRSFRKPCAYPFPPFVLPYLRLVFGYHPPYFPVYNVPLLPPNGFPCSRRQAAAVYQQGD